ncbi:hypothetical protein B0T11DRAFT_281976 [Plectosphaerella cucumerina]|uniref:Uncharacterized protein n=1 Tax=Plectosphaerella cucumerina TaxID=40658 RepID=A0A8K0TGM0_9PEZI|nr:hypothetical protein B0T11DRAFT_281976 [Plectosphaerella cucumerina]
MQYELKTPMHLAISWPPIRLPPLPPLAPHFKRLTPRPVRLLRIHLGQGHCSKLHPSSWCSALSSASPEAPSDRHAGATGAAGLADAPGAAAPTAAGAGTGVGTGVGTGPCSAPGKVPGTAADSAADTAGGTAPLVAEDAAADVATRSAHTLPGNFASCRAMPGWYSHAAAQAEDTHALQCS